jgi:dihydroxyacetone kinase
VRLSSDAAMKHFINNPSERLVLESIEGTLASHRKLSRLEHPNWPAVKVILDRGRHEARQAGSDVPVCVVSGGGSGHEPAFSGYVGDGLLSAAVAGDLFASPPESAVLAALRSTITASGALVVVLCYTGDRLNFGAACEAIRAETGFDARMVIVSDDVALRTQGAKRRKTSARGLAGAMLVLKVAGAAAAAGLSLDGVERVATLVAEGTTTMGCSLTSCTIPGRGRDTQRLLGDTEMEYGLGAHGEPGAYRARLEDLDVIVKTLVERVGCVGDFEDDQKVHPGDDVVILINNMGGTTQLEFGAVVRSCRHHVEKVLGCRVVRMYAGTFLSSLDMKGFSLSLLRLPKGEHGDGEELLRFLDAPTDAPAWPSHQGQPGSTAGVVPEPQLSLLSSAGSGLIRRDTDMERVRGAVQRACAAAVESCDLLNELDAAIGDGDTGSTFRRGGMAVQASEGVSNATSLYEALITIADVAGEAMGGSSGALLKIFFSTMARELGSDPSAEDIAKGVAAGVSKMMFYGGAERGDSTMLDALIPMSEALQDGGGLDKALDAARQGAEETKAMTATCGRASYVPTDVQYGRADPGATAVVLLLEAIAAQR